MNDPESTPSGERLPQGGNKSFGISAHRPIIAQLALVHPSAMDTEGCRK